MKKYKYSVTTNVIWCSFDFGEVEAETREEAREKAKDQLMYDFDKANKAFEHCDNTSGFQIAFNETEIMIEEQN